MLFEQAAFAHGFEIQVSEAVRAETIAQRPPPGRPLTGRTERTATSEPADAGGDT